ncbi:ribonuclease Y [Candidatus Uhrbacteria bacterium]|nr:ribonuclease Y [Candidatus Uhrbacteria bacterium]
MPEVLMIVIGGAAILVSGAAMGYAYRHLMAARRVSAAERRAEEILQDAKRREHDFLLKAKEKGLKIVDDAKREETERRRELSAMQQRLEKRETLFDQKLIELQEQQSRVEEQRTKLEEAKRAIESLRDAEIKKLEEIAQLPRDAAQERLLARVAEDTRDSLTARLRKLEQENAEEIERKARTILSTAIQRLASSHSVETTTSSVTLPSDDMKGRIIGKEGRNIKAIEQLTGCEIIVDETPMTITISGFSPIRRQVAKRAIEDLIQDGRIHPGRVEEAVENAKKELATDVRKAGEDALFQLGITGIDPKLVQVLGRLKYRTSYGQNVLLHSIEVANLAGLMAVELGQNVADAKRGGLFHDIGKSVDHDIPGTHIEIGYNILKKFGMSEEVCYAPIAHHEDKPTTVVGCIVKAADAISGARPGARKDSYEDYLKRLEELERVAVSFEGVDKAYAIQAGREVRVFFSPQKMDDLTMYRTAKEIAKKIEQELTYPGEIKVTAIRETRAIEYAR